MGTVTLEQFLPYVNPATQGCAEFERLQHVKDAVRAFCRESFCWRQRDTALLTTVAAQETYPLTLPAGSELVAVHSAWANGCEIDIEEPGQADDGAPGVVRHRWTVGRETINSLRVLPPPDAGGIAVTGTISLAPSDDATTVPDWLFNRWRDVIAAHAIERLCAQTGKAWTNPGRVATAKQDYDEGLMLASTRAGPVRRKGLRVAVQDVPAYPGAVWGYGRWGRGPW